MRDPINSAKLALKNRERIAANDLANCAYAGFLSAVCEAMGLELQAVKLQLARKGEITLDPDWRAASLARQRAAYLANTAANIRQTAIAHAIGLSRAAVCIACRKVEAARDNPAVDALLDAAAKFVMGSGYSGPKPSLEQFLGSVIQPQGWGKYHAV